MSAGRLVDVLPLSPLQEGLFFHAVYDGGASDVYQVQLVLDLGGRLDPDRLRAAGQALLDRHPNLRAAFLHEGLARPVQAIPEWVALPWRQVDLSTLPEPERAAELDRLLRQERAERFPVGRPPLLRMVLVRLAADRHRLVLTNHHLLLDGWSVPVLLDELFTLYHRADHRAAYPPPPAARYRDYLAWLARQDRGAAAAAWRQELAGIDEPTLLAPAGPARRPEPPEQLPVELPEPVTAALRRLARQRRLTLSTILLGAWGLVLGRLTARREVVFGLTVAGRPAELPGVERMIGLFINTVPVRVSADPAVPVESILARLQAAQTRLTAHQHLGLAEIQQAVGQRELFDTVVVFENYPTAGLARTGDPAGEPRLLGIHGQDASHYPLMLAAVPGERLRLRLDFQPAALPPATVERIGHALEQVLTSIAAAPDRLAGRLDLAGPAQRFPRRGGGQGAARTLPARTVPELFEAQVARTPQAPAVRGGGPSGPGGPGAGSGGLRADRDRLSYAELNERANRLAHLLLRYGAGPERVVALAGSRSVDLVTGLLATLKAGAAYLPVGRQPAGRVASMLADARPALILADAAAATGAAAAATGAAAAATGDLALPGAARSTPVLRLDAPELATQLAGAPSHNPTDADRGAPLTGWSAAYLLYTSGSTGPPKGVVGTHHGLVNRLAWFAGTFPGAGRPACAKTAMTFVDGTTELLEILVSVGEVVVADDATAADPDALADLLAAGRVDTLTAVPSLLDALLAEPARLASLRLLVSSGERLPAELAGRIRDRLPGARLLNLYGCTEVTGDSLAAELPPAGTGEPAGADPPYGTDPPGGTGDPPVGTPIWNTGAHLLDPALRPVPDGGTGELYLTGAGLARGYLGRATATAERFVPDPAGPPGARMYRTGDLARRRPDGSLLLVGRADAQLKVRGFRVEPSEIETRLVEHPDVHQAAVVAVDEPPGRRLVGYVVPLPARRPEPAQLRAALAQALPAPLVPAAIVVLPALPRLRNGKLDRAALPPPPPPDPPDRSRAARTPQEELIAGLFAEVLAADRVGVEDNFFELGGDSLRSTTLAARLRAALGVRVSAATLFEAPTPAALAARLGVDAPSDALQVLLPLRGHGDREPLFCFHPAGGLGWCYAGLLRHLDPRRPVYAVQASGIDRPAPLPDTLDQLADDYLRRIRAAGGDRRYYLLGWSFGGLLAHAVATRLQAAGAEVALLALLDAYPREGLPPLPELTRPKLLALLLQEYFGLPPEALGPDPLDPARAAAILAGTGRSALTPSQLAAVADRLGNNSVLARRFTPARFPGDVLVFRASQGGVEAGAPSRLWAPYVAGRIEEHPVDCTHATMAQPEPLARIGAILAQRMEGAGSP